MEISALDLTEILDEIAKYLSIKIVDDSTISLLYKDLDNTLVQLSNNIRKTIENNSSKLEIDNNLHDKIFYHLLKSSNITKKHLSKKSQDILYKITQAKNLGEEELIIKIDNSDIERLKHKSLIILSEKFA